MSLYGLLNVSAEGLNAASAGLDVTGQNIANVNTPGYARRSANIEAMPVTGNGQGGVTVTTINRTVDTFANARVLVELGRSGSANTRVAQLAQLQSIVAPSTGGVADQTAAFFSSLQDLSASAADPSARATVLSNATRLAATISSTAGQISQAQTSVYTEAQASVSQLNTQLAQIASLNGQVVQTLATGGDATDLEDQRDALVSNVSQQVGVQVMQSQNGSITLYGAGASLVDDNQAATLSVSVGSGPTSPMVFQAQLGNSTTDITSQVTDGTLGGMRESRDVEMANAASSLDQFAYNLSTTVNTIHSAGFGLDGVSGRNLFVAPTSVAGAAQGMAVDPSVAGNPDAIAASGTAADVPGGNTTALALAGLASTAMTPGGQNPGNTLAAIAATVGAAQSSATNEQALRQDTLTQAQNLQQSVSGVSLDEEMTNMTRYQNAYDASSRVLQTADQLMQTLMQVQ